MEGPATAGPFRVLSAGSLRAPFTDLLDRESERFRNEAELCFGPSGLLRDRILAGCRCDLFASASMEHAEALATLRGGRAVPFARNAMCALIAPGLATTSDTLLDDMLGPGMRLGISTPGNDPSGDYALQVFERAEATRPGSAKVLREVAQCLTGDTIPGADDHEAPYSGIMSRGDADIFLTYRSNAQPVLVGVPGTRIVDLPGPLAVSAFYGYVLLSAHPDAAGFADLLRGSVGLDVLAGHGLDPARP